jgi:hypothetical protein
VTRFALPNVLLAPVGLLCAIAVVMPVYWLKAGAWLATPLVVGLAGTGYWLARREMPGRLNPGWLGLAGVGAYALYIAPVVAAGGWTWTGYNFVNDTAVQMLLADHLMHEGMTQPPGTVLDPTESTGVEHIRLYLITGYPLGAHGLLATLKPLTFAPLEALYQPMIGLFASASAVSIGWLLARVSSMALAVVGGLLAVAGNLIYQYGLQGSIKEMAMLAALVTTVAVARHALGSRHVYGAGALIGVMFGAGILIYSTAALPYLGVLAVAIALAAFVQRDATMPLRDLLRAAAAAVLAAAVVSLPTLGDISTFSDTAESAFGGEGAQEVAQGELGHLLRPLKLVQAAGVWLGDDYRIRVPLETETETYLFIWIVIAFLAVGLAHLIARRETGLLLAFVPAAITLAVGAPEVTPYADAKLLALLTPCVVAVAWAGVALLERIRWWAAAPAAALVAAGLLWSDALAYHWTHPAPIGRLHALEDIGERYAGDPERILVNDFEQFAQYFMRDARPNVGLEIVTPYSARKFGTFMIGNVDVDQEPASYLAHFPLIVERAGPDTSRPPANYRFEYSSGPYTVWRRDDAVTVRVHQPFQLLFEGGQAPPCDQVVAFADGARRGERVAVRFRPAQTRFDVANAARRPPAWIAHPYLPNTVIPKSPGVASGDLTFEGGDHRIWVLGSLGREIEVLLDGQVVGEARGINTPGEWLDAGTADMTPGSHRVEVRRKGGSLRPGDGFEGLLGFIAFERVHPVNSVTWMAPREVRRRACGRVLDWIEIGRPNAD